MGYTPAFSQLVVTPFSTIIPSVSLPSPFSSSCIHLSYSLQAYGFGTSAESLHEGTGQSAGACCGATGKTGNTRCHHSNCSCNDCCCVCVQLSTEKEKLIAMKKHLNLSSHEVEALAASVSPVEHLSFNGGGTYIATPTSSPAPPPMKTPHSVAMPTPVLQAVYDRSSQQPLYILQSSNGPTLIPVQMAPPRGGMANSTLAIPTSLSIDQLSGKGLMTASCLQTPTPGTPKQLSFSPAGGFGGGGLEGLMQPSQLLLPQTNTAGMQLSEAGPIRTIVRQAAKERPSPVAMDGKQLNMCVLLNMDHQGLSFHRISGTVA